MIDIPDRTYREDLFQRNEARLAAGADLAGLGFYEVGVGSSVIYLDDHASRIFGIPPDLDRHAAALQFWFEHLHHDDRERVLDLHNRLEDGRDEETVLEYRYLHPALGQRWLSHWARVTQRDTSRAAIRTLGVVRDISEWRQAEHSLREALGEVEHLRDLLARENTYLRQEVRSRLRPVQRGAISAAMRQALSLAERVAPTNSTVLLLGETGTGKERVASLIHEMSPRRDRAMVRVNCAAIPTALVESELFGREKGAFTGALSKQIGRFELAHGSTLFLDEVGELPLDVQVKLLRVLQDHTIERLGSPRSVSVDVRVIAATNRQLEEAVRDGAFRSDLYYRLNVFPIVVPPLRERLEDIPALIEELVEELGVAMGKRFDAVDEASVRELTRRDWPGNVRELRNVLERAMILSPGPVLRVAVPGTRVPARSATSVRPRTELRDVERDHIVRVLEETGWKVRGRNAAAERLGLKPTTLEARMTKLGISRPVPRRHG